MERIGCEQDWGASYEIPKESIKNVFKKKCTKFKPCKNCTKSERPILNVLFSISSVCHLWILDFTQTNKIICNRKNENRCKTVSAVGLNLCVILAEF